jgi:chromosome segregation ATPase
MRNIKPTFVAVIMLSAFGVWGCGQQKTGAISAKITELEARHAKLEEEHRTLQASYDQTRKKLSQIENQRSSLENEKTDLNGQLDKVGAERETLRKQLAERTQERDAAVSNLAQFSKDLQALAGRVESAVNGNASSPNATVIPASRRTE